MNRLRIVTRFTNAAYVIDHMFMLISPVAVFGMAGSFDLDRVSLIGLPLGGFTAFGACSPPVGRLGDIWSRWRMILLSFFGIGAAVLSIGLAGSAPVPVTGPTLTGVFAAIYYPVGTAMLVARVRNRGREIDVNGMWDNLGVVFAVLLIGPLTAHFGWRVALILPGGVAILLDIGFFLYVRKEPSSHLPAKAMARGEDSEGLSMHRVFGVLVLVTATGGVVFSAGTATHPKLFQERLSNLLASPQTLGVAASLAYAFGVVAQLTTGRLIDHLNLKLSFVSLTFCQVPLLLILAYGHGSAMALFGVLFMFAVSSQVTVNDTMTVHFVAPQWQARVLALRYFLPPDAGAVAVPMIAYLEPRQGLLGLYLVLAGFAALTFAIALVLLRPACSAAVGT